MTSCSSGGPDSANPRWSHDQLLSVELPFTDGAGLSQEVSHCIYLDCRQSSDREDEATPANQPTKAAVTVAVSCPSPLLRILHIVFFCLFGLVMVALRAGVVVAALTVVVDCFFFSVCLSVVCVTAQVSEGCGCRVSTGVAPAVTPPPTPPAGLI